MRNDVERTREAVEREREELGEGEPDCGAQLLYLPETLRGMLAL